MREWKKEAAVERAKPYLIDVARRSPVKAAADVKRYHELLLYTLLHMGVDPTDKDVLALVKTVVDAPLDRTYNAALGAMALEALDRTKYRARIAEYAQFLVDQQCTNGQWAYGKVIENKPDLTPKKQDPKKPGSTEVVIEIKRLGKGPATGDNSNAQYAALGLRACAASGLGLPRDTLQLALDWWERAQRGDGSWSYDSKEGLADAAGYLSMTSGGVASLVIYRSLLGVAWDKDAKIKKGVDWIAANWSVKENTKHRNPQLFSFYALYAIERVGSLMSLPKIGDKTWYEEGVDHLVATQLKQGCWDSKLEMETPDTCFAILFLRRATRPAPKIASGVK